MTKGRFIYAFFTAVCALSLLACSSEDPFAQPQSNVVTSKCYMNFVVTVDNGNVNVTRAPQAGENGDGREAAFARENAIEGITVIFYGDSINSKADSTLRFVKYMPVTLISRDDQGTMYDSKTDEAYYTTGFQPVGDAQLDFAKKYHAVVIANRRTDLIEGVSKISDVKKMTTSVVYDGEYTSLPSTCTNFLITSESDDSIDFSKITPAIKEEPNAADSGDMYYDLTKYPIRIERMAARIDFHATCATKNAEGKDSVVLNGKDKNGKAYSGYVYPVWKTSDADDKPTSNDRFVLKYVIPFNLNDGEEYMLKRFSDGKFLSDETGKNAVVDPTTGEKTATTIPSYFINPLDSLLAQVKNEKETSNKYAKELAKLYDDISNGSGTKSFVDNGYEGDNLIISYMKENTLQAEAPLYYNATGVMIVGDYYKGNDSEKEPTRYVYFSYLRHQGESDEPYEPYRYDYEKGGVKDIDLAKAAINSATDPMNFGVVRNNIYRVRINRVSEQGDITLTIKVKKWDPYTHSVIYM